MMQSLRCELKTLKSVGQRLEPPTLRWGVELQRKPFVPPPI